MSTSIAADPGPDPSAVVAPEPAEQGPVARSQRQLMWARLKQDRVAIVSLWLVVALIVIAILAPLIVKQIFSIIREINEQQGMTVFLVEQNANHALKLAHRGYVMVNGTVTMSGTGAELLTNAEVRAAYLEGGH